MTIVTTAVAMERSEEALRSQITLTHEARAHNAAQEVEKALDRAKDIARATASTDEMKRPIEADMLDENGTVPPGALPLKRLILEQTHRTDDAFDGAMIVDPTGTILMGEPVDLQHEQTSATKDPFIAERYRRIAEFTSQMPVPVVHAGGIDEERWTVSARLQDQGGQVWGVVILPATTQALGDLISATNDDVTFFVILDQTGTVLIGPDGFLPGTDLGPQHEALLQADRTSGVITHDEKEYLATLAPLGDDWRLVVAQDSKIAFAPVDAMLTTILVVAGFVIAIGVATGLLVAGRITAPVVRLKQAAERMAEGEYGTQVRTTNKDELAELAGAFNIMSARLLEEHERLRRHQDSLKATVTERTGELAEKNEELEAFVYATSHDLRTPLITLDWLLEELQAARENDDDETVEETIRRMRANVDGMDQLIDDLLELSRIGRTEGEPQGVMLRPLIEGTLENLGHRMQETGTTVHIHFDDSVIIEADPRRMEQVFHNLVSNAIKYGRKNGNVHVRAKAIGDPQRPWKWRLEVADDGPGIDPDQRETVFQLFRRGVQPGDKEVEGTGVGLALVRKIIRAYGGDIKATSANEGGALFWFTLNAARPGTSPTRVDAGPDAPTRIEPGPSAGRPLPRQP